MELLCWTGAEGVYCRRVIQRTPSTFSWTLFCFCEFEKCDITGSIVVSSDSQNVKIYRQFRKCNFEVQTWNCDCSESREVNIWKNVFYLLKWSCISNVIITQCFQKLLYRHKFINPLTTNDGHFSEWPMKAIHKSVLLRTCNRMEILPCFAQRWRQNA